MCVPVILWTGRLQKLPVFCLLKVAPSASVALPHARCQLQEGVVERDFNVQPGSSQQPFPWEGKHEAPHYQLQDQGREGLGASARQSSTELESWEG